MHSYTSLLAAIAGLAASTVAQDVSSVASITSNAASAATSGVVASASGVASSASAATSTFSQSNVPTGTPLPGNYGGAYRPQVHFSPPQGFMNDPNGMFVDAEGVYHLYYQYNPTANIAGKQHWGHATSTDLFTWKNQQIAIFPGSEEEGVFSGSAVIDANNTSGMFPNQTNGVVAIYTINTPQQQTQDIAFSYDGGYTFEKYENNPVIRPGGTNPNQFRDPKVIWYEPTESWVMVIAYPIDFEVGIFTSPNLIDWTPTSNFSRYGLSGLQYECPNMVEITVQNATDGEPESRWAMTISINPGAPLGGSVTQYFLGDFNGTHFVPDDALTRLTDFAKDNYAGQFFYGIPADQDQISMAWASNWQYTNVVPTAGQELGDGFRSAMSVARGHYLKNLPRQGLTLVQYPANLDAVIDSELASNNSLGNSTILVDYSQVESGALYFEANITGLSGGDSLDGTLNFTALSSVSGESVSGGIVLPGDPVIWMNRGKTDGFENPFFTDKFSYGVVYDPNGDGAFRLSGIIDRSIIELFFNGGEAAATSVFFPTRPLDTLIVKTAGLNETLTASVAVWSLKAAWLDQADSNDTVLGNVTASSNSTLSKRSMNLF
ncbi:beta-fructofuranosidase [Stagonosporopsis vannaccii]|nr:beta-fructofuranosidase [Stagonosporopsis vannaccii]